MPLAPVANTEHQVAIASLAANELPEDSPFYESRNLPGFHEAILETLQELRREGIETAGIEELSHKVRNVAFLEKSFDEHLEKLRMTTLSHRLLKMLDCEPKRTQSLRHIYWLGETQWPELWLQFAEWVLNAGINIVFLAERHLTERTFFRSTNSLRARFPGAKLIEMEQTSSAGAHLFSVNQPTTDSSSISMMEAADEFLETEWAVRMAKSHLDSGRKVCMFVRTLQSYGPLLEAAAKRIGLQLQMSRQEPLMTNPFARHCLAALKASATDSLPLLSSLVLTSYGNVARDERRTAADEIRVCAKAADRFAKLKEQAEDKQSPVPSWFAKLLTWRERALLSPATLSDWLIGLNKLISITPWLDMSTAGDTADRDNVAQDAMVRSLSVSKIAAEPTRLFTFAEFVDHCERIWLNADYWYRSHKGIKVVSSPWEIGDAEIVIALGIVEGRFPKRRAEDPILLDVDRAAINQKLGSDKLRSSYEKAEDDQRDGDIKMTFVLAKVTSPHIHSQVGAGDVLGHLFL